MPAKLALTLKAGKAVLGRAGRLAKRRPAGEATRNAIRASQSAGSGALAAAKTGGGGLLRLVGKGLGFVAPILAPLAVGHVLEARRRKKTVTSAIEELQDPTKTKARIQERVFRENLSDRLFSAKLARMQRVAGSDPRLFQFLTALIAGSSRPRTTDRTIRIGPEPSAADMVNSGLFG